MFKNKEALEKKIEKIVSTNIVEWKKDLRRYKREGYGTEYIHAKLGNPMHHSFALQYKKRKGIFSKKNVSFDPMTGNGYSYEWYELTKVINGKLVLNNYPYSSTTNRHIWQVASVMRSLGLKFVEIQAPNGLQNLEIAKQRMLQMYAEFTVRLKYARKKYHARNGNFLLKDAKAIGMQFSDTEIAEAIERAETERRERLDQQKMKRMFNGPSIQL